MDVPGVSWGRETEGFGLRSRDHTLSARRARHERNVDRGRSGERLGLSAPCRQHRVRCPHACPVPRQ